MTRNLQTFLCCVTTMTAGIALMRNSFGLTLCSSAFVVTTSSFTFGTEPLLNRTQVRTHMNTISPKYQDVDNGVGV